MTPEDLGPEVCHRGHRNEDQDPEGHGPCERCECPRFEVLRNENLLRDARTVVHDGLVSPLLMRANVSGASYHRVTSRLSRVLT